MAIISSRPSVALIKTRWRKKGARTLADRAGVVGANVWKISLEIFKHMEKEGFRFGSDRLVTDVLAEFIAFLVQLADRAVYGKLSEADRGTLIAEVAGHLAATMEREAVRRRTSVSQVAREAIEARLGRTATGRRELPFVALGRSGYRSTARDIDTILETEWVHDRDR